MTPPRPDERELMIEPNSDLPEFELRDVSTEKSQEPAQSGGCGCGCNHEAEPPRLDARPFPPRLRHPAILGAVSSLNVGEAMELVAPHVPTPLLNPIDMMLEGEFAYELVAVSDEGAIVKISRVG